MIRAAVAGAPMTQAELDAYYASHEAEADYQDAKRACRERREQLIAEAFRVRAAELAAMRRPAGRTASRTRERRDAAGRSSSRGGDDDGDGHPADPPLARARLRAGSRRSRAPPRPPRGWNAAPGLRAVAGTRGDVENERRRPDTAAALEVHMSPTDKSMMTDAAVDK